MDLIELYRNNPCGVLSIPYWKNKHIEIPQNMRIVHDSRYRKSEFPEYHDEPYFRLQHTLAGIPSITLDGISVISAGQKDIPLFVDVINRSYTDLSVTPEQLAGYTRTEAYCPELWIMAVDDASGCIAGCGIADFDGELREGILEWVQVLPAYRGKRIGSLIVSELLMRMERIADFATVSGKINNPPSPERLYRKCGFAGNDVWHILTKEP